MKKIIFIILLTNVLFAKTQIVFLGTGTPVLDYERAGASTAIVYNDKAYLFDIGAGSLQNAIKAAQKLNIKALLPTNINFLFITHLHSDHILDYPTLLSTLWWRRNSQINVFGPEGLSQMNDGYEQFLNQDTKIRINGIQPVKNPNFYKAKINQYKKGGWVIRDGNVTIEAFLVKHGEINPAFGYKITTPEKTIVISGDTAYSEELIEKSRGVDVLIHEVISEEGLRGLIGFWQKYHEMYHTTTTNLAKIASIAKPKLLILTHVLYYKAKRQSALDEVKAKYKGKVVLANDLDIF